MGTGCPCLCDSPSASPLFMLPTISVRPSPSLCSPSPSPNCDWARMSCSLRASKALCDLRPKQRRRGFAAAMSDFSSARLDGIRGMNAQYACSGFSNKRSSCVGGRRTALNTEFLTIVGSRNRGTYSGCGTDADGDGCMWPVTRRKARRRRRGDSNVRAEASIAAGFGDTTWPKDGDGAQPSSSSPSAETLTPPPSGKASLPAEGAAVNGNGAVLDALTDGEMTDAEESDGGKSGSDGGAGWNPFRPIVYAFRAVISVLPYGSWWDIGGLQEDTPAPDLWESLGKLWVFVAPDRVILSLAFLCLIAAALSELSIPHYMAATIFSASSGKTAQFYSNAKILTVMTLTYGVFSGLRGGFFSICNQLLVRRMREKLYGTIMRQDVAFFDKEAVGDLTSRLGSDCQMVSRIIGVDINIMLRNTLQGLGALAYLVTLSWPLAVSTAAVCALMWTFMMAYGRFQRRAAKVVQDTIASANEVAEETFSLARVVRTFGTESREVERYSKWAKKLVDINARQSVAYGFWTWSSNTLYNATQVVALFIGGGYVMGGAVTAEQLTKYILYAEWVVHATWWVGDHWALLMEAMGASDKVFRLLDLPPAQQLSAQGGLQLANFQGHVEFRNVSFHYPTRPSVEVLSNVNLTVKPGELVALVGLSGSGKSTLVSLLERLYEPTKGEIFIDGVPLTDLDVGWYRRQLGVVSQEPRLFTTDIAANITYGSGPEVTAMDVERASRQANAHGFITSLPEGYATEVGNARLSGGQKQRIAIARALVRDPTILILDEATSALDAESEHNVQLALDRAMRAEGGQRRRTVFVIAHRLSTVRAADRIIVMKHGKISEVGSHEELIEKDGEYARLTRRQLSTLP